MPTSKQAHHARASSTGGAGASTLEPRLAAWLAAGCLAVAGVWSGLSWWHPAAPTSAYMLLGVVPLVASVVIGVDGAQTRDVRAQVFWVLSVMALATSDGLLLATTGAPVLPCAVLALAGSLAWCFGARTPWRSTLAILSALAGGGALGVAALRGMSASTSLSPVIALVHLLALGTAVALLGAVATLITSRPPQPATTGRHAAVSHLGSYRLIKKLGEGGMGEVWRAEHELLKRPAAVKIIRALEDQPHEQVELARERFEREAQVTAQLTSMHTVRVYDFGVTEDEHFFYAMELLDGVDLETLIHVHGPQPQERVRAWLLQMCDSLAEAHAAGLVHRDIKPANFFLCRQGRTYGVVKLLDFGLVTMHMYSPLLGQRGGAGDDALGLAARRLTVQGTISGTPEYMAPEQAQADATVDHRADVYALACVAYYALTGRDVFEHDDPVAVLAHHILTEPTPPSARTSGVEVTRQFEAVLMRCLSKDPEQRPQSAVALSQLVRACRMDRIWSHEAERLWAEQHMGAPPLPDPEDLPDYPPLPAPPSSLPSVQAVGERELAVERAMERLPMSLEERSSVVLGDLISDEVFC